jgi:hypothetical protein
MQPIELEVLDLYEEIIDQEESSCSAEGQSLINETIHEENYTERFGFVHIQVLSSVYDKEIDFLKQQNFVIQTKCVFCENSLFSNRYA